MHFWKLAVIALACGCVSHASAADNSSALQGTLNSYLTATTTTASRGLWYNIQAWGARTSHCLQDPSATTCMACSMNMPQWAAETGTVPMAVSNDLWFNPQRGATCGMCLRVYIVPPSKTGACANEFDTNCPGEGTHSYADNVSKDFAYGGKVLHDDEMGMDYFNAVIIEWLDRNQTSAAAISYPVKGLNTDDWGNWPVQYRAVPCPTASHNMSFAFLNASSPVPAAQASNQSAWTQSGSSAGLPQGVGSSLCNNLYNQPCGQDITTASSPLAWIKFQIIGQRIPVSGVRLQWQDGTWGDMKTTGDGYWQPISGPSTQDPNKPIQVEVQCSDGSPVKTQSLMPIDMICGYQDPGCQPRQGTIQC